MIKVNITRNETNQQWMCYYNALRRTSHFCDFPAKKGVINSQHKETSDKHKFRVILQNKYPVLFKNVSHKKKKTYFRLKEIKDLCQLIAMCDPRLNIKQRQKCTDINPTYMHKHRILLE